MTEFLVMCLRIMVFFLVFPPVCQTVLRVWVWKYQQVVCCFLFSLAAGPKDVVPRSRIFTINTVTQNVMKRLTDHCLKYIGEPLSLLQNVFQSVL